MLLVQRTSLPLLFPPATTSPALGSLLWDSAGVRDLPAASSDKYPPSCRCTNKLVPVSGGHQVSPPISRVGNSPESWTIRRGRREPVPGLGHSLGVRAGHGVDC